MYKVFGFIVFLILFSGPSGQTFGQVTGNNQSSPASQTNTEANRLVQEGIELTGAGQFAQAVRAFEDAIKLDPQYADAYAALGRAYFKMREWRRAVDNLHRASALKAKQQASQQLFAAPKSTPSPNPNAGQTQQEQTIATGKDSALVSPKLPEQKLDTTTATPPAPPAKINVAAVSVARPPQSPTPSDQTPKSESSDVETQAAESQRTTPEVTQAEKVTGEAPPLKSDAAHSSEEIPKPTGVSVSMAPPTSSTIESSVVTPIPLKPSNEDLSLTKIYRVGPGDVLDIRINEAQPQQSTLFTVNATGQLEHPMLAEPLNVSTLTTEEIETKFEDDLKSRALVENPEVTVAVRDYASHAILVSGLVKEAGTRFLRREAIPLYVVVADAQPLPEAAKVTVVRNELKQMFEIELTKVADMSLLVRPGDVVNLQRNETQFIYVGGEVKAPGEKIFRSGLTLTQAIISAGGTTSKSKAAEIGRDDGQGFLVKTSFKLEDIHTGKVMDPLIRPGDRIMILR